jgi:D-alanyl-D-alanine carboxypeptidase/D-alanyl-D-alanine-endopeptidase (penicillin-binding protein 4)
LAGVSALVLAPAAAQRHMAAPSGDKAPLSTSTTTTSGVPAPSTTAAPTTTTTTTTGAPPPAPAAGAIDPAFAARVGQVIAAHAGGLQVSVSVVRADGVPVVAHNTDAPVLPASTQKIVTAAAALNDLGGGFRYVTRAATTTPVDGGTVAGDLVLVGAGDPALGGPDFGAIRPERPRTPLEVIADGVVAAGIRRVDGRVVGDAGVFPHQPVAPGWLDTYVSEGDATVSSGLTVNASRRIWHDGAGYQSEPTTDPANEAAAVLTELLRHRGVHVAHGSTTSLTPVPTTQVVAEVTGPPLGDLLRHMMQASDNQFADAIFRTVGLHAGDATWKGSATAVVTALGNLGIDTAGVAVSDGSGLSRTNRLTAGFLLGVDHTMFHTGHAPLWKELPAVAAASGTLHRRLIGTAADHRLRGKTGSLRDVNALAGSVYASGAPRWRFAVIGNGLDPAGKRVVRDLQDAVALALAEEAAGCESTGCPPVG